MVKQEPNFKPGDTVHYTNGYGHSMGLRRVLSHEYWPCSGFRYYIEPTDTPWYPVGESQLSLALGRKFKAGAVVSCLEANHAEV